MRMVGWNMALSFAWCALNGRLTMTDLVIGYVVGYGLLGWLIPGQSARGYVRRIPRVLAFILIYAYEVTVSTIRVAWEIMTPVPRRSPGLIEVPLEVTSDVEITMLANLITFTPGTVTIDIADDRSHLIVHDMFLRDPEAARRHIKRRYESWVLRLMR